MDERDSLYKQFTIQKEQTQKSDILYSYKRHRNIIINPIQSAKNIYFANYMTDHPSNIWKT